MSALFRAPEWMVVESGPLDITAVRTPGVTDGRTIPGTYAVVRRGTPAQD